MKLIVFGKWDNKQYKDGRSAAGKTYLSGSIVEPPEAWRLKNDPSARGTFHNVVAFGLSADRIVGLGLKHGDLILISGNLGYDVKDGKRVGAKIVAEDLTILARAGSMGSPARHADDDSGESYVPVSTPAPPPAPAPEMGGYEEDIPF